MSHGFPDYYGPFLRALQARLIKGQQTYGSASFERPDDEILTELQEEALDLAGWGYVLYAKIEAYRSKQAAAQSEEEGL